MNPGNEETKKASKAANDGWFVVKAKRATSTVPEIYADFSLTRIGDLENERNGQQKTNQFAVLWNDDDDDQDVVTDVDDSDDHEVDADDDGKKDMDDEDDDVDDEDDDVDEDNDDDDRDIDDEYNIEDDDDEYNIDDDDEYDFDNDDADKDDDGNVDKYDDKDGEDNNKGNGEENTEEGKAKKDNMQCGVTRTGTKFREVELKEEDTNFVSVPGSSVNLRKSGTGKKKKISDVKKKAMRQRKATSTFHSRLNVRGDEQVTKNTIKPKSKSVLHDFATDGKDDHD
jgi:hypothetical protein